MDNLAIITPEALADLLPQPGWFIISATQEAEGDWNVLANLMADLALFNTLCRRDNDIARGKRTQFGMAHGYYKGVDQGPSYIVLGTEEEGLELARAFGQESILTNRGLVYADGRPVTPANHRRNIVGDAATAEVFYTTIFNIDDTTVAFSVGLDF